MLDRVFLKPRAVIHVFMYVPNLVDQPLKRAKFAVFIDALVEAVSARMGYEATLACTCYSAKVYENIGIKFKFKGFNHKLPLFVE